MPPQQIQLFARQKLPKHSPINICQMKGMKESCYTLRGFGACSRMKLQRKEDVRFANKNLVHAISKYPHEDECFVLMPSLWLKTDGGLRSPLVFGCHSALALSRCTNHVGCLAADENVSGVLHSMQSAWRTSSGAARTRLTFACRLMVNQGWLSKSF